MSGAIRGTSDREWLLRFALEEIGGILLLRLWKAASGRSVNGGSSAQNGEF